MDTSPIWRILILWSMLPYWMAAQVPDTTTLPVEEIISSDLIEDFVAAGGEEADFDFNALYEDLAYYRKKPLDLNKVKRTELEGLRLLSDVQINQFLNYRKTCGDFIALQELQAIPSFSLETISQLLPFVKLGGQLDDFKVPLTKMLYQGDHELFLRWTRFLEEKEGFLRGPEDGNYFLGDRNQYYLRYRYRYSNRMSYGLTAEKDEGEEFFTGSNPNGFDFYSAHFYLRDYSNLVKTVALGDFNVSFGQGLILFSGFGGRKGATVMNIKRNFRTISPYRSADENRFLRGAGLTLGFGDNLEATVFGSVRKRDANLVAPDSLVDIFGEIPIEFLEVSSLQGTGLHRTPAEIADEKQIEQRTLGASLKYQTDQWHIAANALYENLDRSLNVTSFPFNQFYFSGTTLFNASLDYSYLYKNYNFFGETAISDNGGFATTNGLLIGLDRKFNIAVLYRHFDRNYQALNPNPFAETTGARNEQGLYLAMDYLMGRGFKLSGYYDLYQHPWLRFATDAPSRGIDYRLRLTYFQKRKLEAYLELRNETKQRNATDNETRTNFLVNNQRFQLRLHFAQTISKSLRLRNRVDFGFAQDGTEERQLGFMAYQDILWKSVEYPISITSRLAIFDTDGFDVRFFHFENNLIYNFSIPAYYNRGTRFYINLRYTGIRNLSLEARLARTHWSNQESFSSGLNEVAGQNRTELKGQMKFTF